MSELALVIDGAPVPCPRPRIVCKPFPNAYYPKAYKDYQKATEKQIVAQLGKGFEPLHGSVSVIVDFHIQRPKKTKALIPKGDIDNYIKAVLDACTAAGVWEDDKQVVAITAVKGWAPVYGPRTVIAIEEHI